jgi:hypothetical protein
MQRYGDSRRLHGSPAGSRRSSEPAAHSPGTSASSGFGRGNAMGRGGLAAIGSGRGSMMKQQVASKRIDFSQQGRTALDSVNSDDEEPPLSDRYVYEARHTLVCHLCATASC